MLKLLVWRQILFVQLGFQLDAKGALVFRVLLPDLHPSPKTLPIAPKSKALEYRDSFHTLLFTEPNTLHSSGTNREQAWRQPRCRWTRNCAAAGVPERESRVRTSTSTRADPRVQLDFACRQ